MHKHMKMSYSVVAGDPIAQQAPQNHLYQFIAHG